MSGLPKAFKAVSRFRLAHNSKFVNYLRYFHYTYFWEGRKYGLQFHDLMLESAPIVTEALRRLSIKEPHVYDQRVKRLHDAHNMRENLDMLPRKEWTQWDDETFYLHDYLAELYGEMDAKKETTGVAPKYMKQENNEYKL